MKLNQIYQGDNIHFMKDMNNESIDLIYIDPPFGTQSLWSSKAWKGQKVQEMAFYDSWGGGINGYIEFMTERLRHMHRLLKPTGSLFVHLDWRASHYIKIELDKIFGVTNPTSSKTNFINEIIWCYKSGGASKKSFSKKHDTILFYSKDYKKHKLFLEKEKSYRNESGAPIGKQKYLFDEKGKYTLVYPKDWWEIPMLAVNAKERVGWPTQKPRSLLEKIIKQTTKEGDIVVDFFCGCGTAIDAAETLNRRWIGFDASKAACEAMITRMEDRHSIFQLEINKKPTTYEEFKRMNPFEFEKAVVRHIGGVTNEKQVADGGVDGRLSFDGTPIQVKKENKKIGDVDKFRGFYIHLKQHGRGIFVSQEGFTPKAKERAASWRREDLDIQLLDLKDVIDGNYREQPIAS